MASIPKKMKNSVAVKRSLNKGSAKKQEQSFISAGGIANQSALTASTAVGGVSMQASSQAHPTMGYASQPAYTAEEAAALRASQRQQQIMMA